MEPWLLSNCSKIYFIQNTPILEMDDTSIDIGLLFVLWTVYSPLFIYKNPF